METHFFSKRNYQLIYNIFRKNLKKIIDKEISETPEYKNSIIQSMKYIYSRRDRINIPENLSDIEKSAYLSKHLIRILIQREQDLIKKNPTPTPNGPKKPVTTLKSDYTEDVNKRLKEVEKERTQNNKANVNDFYEDNRKINNKVTELFEDNVDIHSKYAEMTKSRQYQYENLDDGMRRPEMFQPIVEGNPLKIINEVPYMPEDNVNMDTLLENFQTLPETIIKDPIKPTFNIPKKTPSKSVPTNSTLEFQTIVKTIPKDTPKSPVIPVKKKTDPIFAGTTLETVGINEDARIKYDEVEEKKKSKRKPRSRLLIINSADRDLSHIPENFNKYDFQVTFNNKNKNPPFPNVPTAIKNVVEITLKRACIPRPYFFTAFPFLFLKISQMNSNIVSTHRSGKDVFSKIVFDKMFDSVLEYEDSSGRRIRHREYMYYINGDGESIKFRTPLASIDSLNLELFTPGFKNVQDYWVDSDIGWTDGTGIKNGIATLSGVYIPSKAGTRYANVEFFTDKQKITDRFLANTYVTDILKDAKTGQEYKVISYTQQTGTQENATQEGTPAVPPTITLSEIGDFRRGKMNVDNEIQFVNMSNQIQYIFEVKTV